MEVSSSYFKKGSNKRNFSCRNEWRQFNWLYWLKETNFASDNLIKLLLSCFFLDSINQPNGFVADERDDKNWNRRNNYISHHRFNVVSRWHISLGHDTLSGTSKRNDGKEHNNKLPRNRIHREILGKARDVVSHWTRHSFQYALMKLPLLSFWPSRSLIWELNVNRAINSQVSQGYWFSLDRTTNVL